MSLPNNSEITANQLAPQNADVDTALQNLPDKAIEDGADKIRLKSGKNVPDKAGDADEDSSQQDDKKARRTSEEKEIDELADELKTDDNVDDTEEEIEDPEKIEQRINNNELVAPPRRKDILAKYPNLFKDFPGLEDAYYRDQQMKNYFATPAEAKDAIETLQQFDSFRQDLLQGNLDSVFKTVREADPNAFARIVDNVLVSIGKHDTAAYYHLVAEQTRATVNAMLQTAQQSNDENLRTAAGYLWNFVFRGQPFDGNQRPYARQQQQQEQPNQLEQERQQFFAERLNTYQQDVDNKVGTHLKSIITTNIDRNNQMPDWVKTKATEDVINQVSSQLQNDREFRTQLNKYWERAAQQNFSQQSLDAIRNFAITRGRQILPQILVKTRNAALQGISRQPRPKDNSPVTSGRPAASSNSGKNVDAQKLKSMDVRDAFDAALGD